MFLVRVQSADEVKPIIEDLDNIDDFDHLDLGEVNNLILSEINIDYVDWEEEEPIHFDESTGLSVQVYDISCLDWFNENYSLIEEYGVDKGECERFTSKKDGLIVAVDTF